MLLDYEGSVICFDPKGQNACITAAHRQRRLKQNVVLLNPFEQWPEFLGHFTHSGVNPIASLDPLLFGFGSDCDALAEGLVIKNPNDRDSHFTESAQQTVSGAIMFIRKYAQESKRNLVSVYELISSAGFFDFARDAVRKGDPLISGRLGRFGGATPDNRELMGVLSTAITNLRFLERVS